MDGAKNERLAQAMADAGLSRKALARAVREHAARKGLRMSTDHTAVGRWLDGTMPRPATADLIADAVSQRLGRRVMASDLGMGSAPEHPTAGLGLRLADDLGITTGVVTRLASADLAGEEVIVGSDVSGPAWSSAALQWLIGRREPAPREVFGGRLVGMADVCAVQASTAAFSDLDNRFGGGHARRALIRYLSDEVFPLLSARVSPAAEPAFFTAAAEATLLAAWMTYDACHHGLAQRYFIQALRLADAAGDRRLAASIMSAMSHQATYVGRYTEAAELARAAVAGITTVGSDTMRAQFHAMEARALARLGEQRACDLAMADAVAGFERRRPDDDPAWIAYFDDAELAAELGHCHRDLRRSTDALTYAQQSLSPDGVNVRSDFFVTMVRADALATAGDHDQAAAVVTGALALGASLRSARCAGYLTEFRRRLDATGAAGVLAQLGEQHREHQLWIASSEHAA